MDSDRTEVVKVKIHEGRATYDWVLNVVGVVGVPKMALFRAFQVFFFKIRGHLNLNRLKYKLMYQSQ